MTACSSVEALNAVSNEIIGAAIEVHRELGPGLLESIYRDCLARELAARRLQVEREVEVPVRYKGEALGTAYRLDLRVAGELVVETKAVEALLPVHQAQLLTYLRLTGSRLGLLLNFNIDTMRNGIRRVVNGL